MERSKRAGASIILALVILPFTYFINNKGECCDQIFQAGWPFAFYGGSGGFLGKTSDEIMLGGLVLDSIFWFAVFYLILTVLFRLRTFKRKKLKKYWGLPGLFIP